jgi:kynureninase
MRMVNGTGGTLSHAATIASAMETFTLIQMNDVRVEFFCLFDDFTDYTEELREYYSFEHTGPYHLVP